MSVGSALFLALKNVGTRAVSPEVPQPTIVLANFAFTGVFAGVYLIVGGVPIIEPAFWWSILLVSFLDVAAVTTMTFAIATSDLSDSYPLIALTPAFGIVSALVIVNEFPSPLGLVGVLVITVGAYLLRLDGSRSGALAPFRRLARDRSARAMMLTAFLFSVMGPLFKTAIQASSVPLALFAAQLFAMIWLSLFYAIRGELGGRVRNLIRHAPPLAGLSLANFGQAVLAFFALDLTLVAYSGSVRRVEILFTLILGHIFFRERNAGRGLLAGIVMIAGVILISVGSM